ncbi:hypothetical protein PISS_a0632 [Pseudoalteromonas issachenkonii]|uniref:Uncharacterized protein n=1 Tax=Pseudoalteromonas issachenkonii TaxID=152297 RepID=A0ABM6N0C5_9GAMM|nr:hypothetical protein PISS_a0632 [Pseudoalteromonas issachenkonii]
MNRIALINILTIFKISIFKQQVNKQNAEGQVLFLANTKHQPNV